ncbi:hypothetical protein LTR04_006613 [Oleoguttula sp. CCFEE 6159]|nr:hypothetical protein LTR04_006613 [Oleoguttula sp. CCFEE 6159]
MPSPGFQALILCGPGVSLNTFTSNPKEFPKALLPIANRPMVWYPLDWCYRMGITNIKLVTPPESAPALEAALSQNPHLTSLPAPKPDVLAPPELTQTTGTGDIFRFPSVRAAITGDFVLLPCDLVCELDGSSLLETWLIHEAGLGGASGGLLDFGVVKFGLGGEKSGRRGGLAVWYPTKGSETGVKNEETDFIATTPLPVPIVTPPRGSLRSDIAKLVYAIPTDTLKDITDEHKSFPIRHRLLRKHGRVKMQTTHRDAHIYFFPYWVLDMLKVNESFDSVSEDVLGWWAKAGWQEGLGDKLGLREVFEGTLSTPEGDIPDALVSSGVLEEEVDVGSMSSTWTSTARPRPQRPSDVFASRVPSLITPTITVNTPLTIPPILAYVQQPSPSAPLIRRVDTAAALLVTSLHLAKLPSLDSVDSRTTASPFAHASKIAYPDGISRPSRVETADSLLAENVTVGAKANIKECVIGANCSIGISARLTRCLLMEGAVVGDGAQLTGCVLGRRCKVEGGEGGDGERTKLVDCEVQEGNVVPWGTEAKNEKFMVFEGLEDDVEVEDDGYAAEAVDDQLGVEEGIEGLYHS